MRTIEEVYQALKERQKDWELRLVVADWFEEQGDLTSARAFRWMAKHQKSPKQVENWVFAWYDASWTKDEECTLPEVFFKLYGWYSLSRRKLRETYEAFIMFFDVFEHACLDWTHDGEHASAIKQNAYFTVLSTETGYDVIANRAIIHSCKSKYEAMKTCQEHWEWLIEQETRRRGKRNN